MSESKDTEGLVRWAHRGRERLMYPEVAEYLRAYRQAKWDHEDATGLASEELRQAQRRAARVAEAEGRAWDPYNNRTDRAAQQEYNHAYEAALDAAERVRGEVLRTVLDGLINSSHREVAWIARTILQDRADNGEHTEYARDILAILPASTEEIWEEAKDNRGMCDVFDRYYDQAEAAGIFNADNKAPVAAREISALRSYIRRNYGGNYVARFMEKVSPVLKAYREDYDKRLAEAKAEWQHLDEAYRSNAARKAAETRRRNAAEATQVNTAPTSVDFAALT